MISKKDIHELVAFHNNWLNNNSIITYINPFKGKFVSIRFAYYKINKDNSLGKLIFSVDKNLKNKVQLEQYKKEVLSTLGNCLSNKEQNMPRQEKLKKAELVFIGCDYWSRSIYSYHGKFFKDITLKGAKDNIPDILYSTVNNDRDGELNYPYEFE